MSELTIKATKSKTSGKTPIKTQRKRVKNRLSKSKKKKLWELYDSEVVACESDKDKALDKTDVDSSSGGGSGGKSDGNPDGKKLECVYRSCGEREVCDICNDAVFNIFLPEIKNTIFNS